MEEDVKNNNNNLKVNFFWNLKGWWASEKEEKNPPQCFVWFSTGLGSSQNSQNSLIHNWCIGGCWVTEQAEKLKRRPFHFPLPIFVFVDEVFHPILFFMLNYWTPANQASSIYLYDKSKWDLWRCVELNWVVFDENCSNFNNSLHRRSKHYETTSMQPPLYSDYYPLRNFQQLPRARQQESRLDDSRRSYCDKQNKTNNLPFQR